MSEKIPTRDGFGEEIAELGKTNKKIAMVSADLEDATRAEYFRDAYPDRFFTVGIAEQDMVGMAAGLASPSRPGGLGRMVQGVLRAPRHVCVFDAADFSGRGEQLAWPPP